MTLFPELVDGRDPQRRIYLRGRTARVEAALAGDVKLEDTRPGRRLLARLCWSAAWHGTFDAFERAAGISPPRGSRLALGDRARLLVVAVLAWACAWSVP